jgi:hypothetical protein
MLTGGKNLKHNYRLRIRPAWIQSRRQPLIPIFTDFCDMRQERSANNFLEDISIKHATKNDCPAYYDWVETLLFANRGLRRQRQLGITGKLPKISSLISM